MDPRTPVPNSDGTNCIIEQDQKEGRLIHLWENQVPLTPAKPRLISLSPNFDRTGIDIFVGINEQKYKKTAPEVQNGIVIAMHNAGFEVNSNSASTHNGEFVYKITVSGTSKDDRKPITAPDVLAALVTGGIVSPLVGKVALKPHGNKIYLIDKPDLFEKLSAVGINPGELVAAAVELQQKGINPVAALGRALQFNADGGLGGRGA